MGLCVCGEMIEEIVGGVCIMCFKVLFVVVFVDVIDMCGMGGDVKGIYNILMVVVFVVVVCGVLVVKYGNKVFFFKLGLVEVFEYFGVRFLVFFE